MHDDQAGANAGDTQLSQNAIDEEWQPGQAQDTLISRLPLPSTNCTLPRYTPSRQPQRHDSFQSPCVKNTLFLTHNISIGPYFATRRKVRHEQLIKLHEVRFRCLPATKGCESLFELGTA